MADISTVALNNYRVALAWTGTNENQFAEFLDIAGLTGSAYVDDDHLVVEWDAGSWFSSGSVFAYADYTVYTAAYGAGLEAVPNETFNRVFVRIHP